MIKGIIGSLIAAAVFFTAGEITLVVLGTKSLGEREFKDMELFKDAPKLVEVVSESKFKGEEVWEFDAEGTVGIVSTKAHTRIVRTDGGKVTLLVKTGGRVSAAITAAQSKQDGYLGISVRGNTLFTSDEPEVEIGLPDKVFDGLEIDLGSGELKASEIKAVKQVLDVGSGKMEYVHAADHKSSELKVYLRSGKLNVSEIKAEKAEVDVGSGIMEYRQAADCEAKEFKAELHSGKLNALEIKAEKTELDISSGVLEYVQAAGYKGEKISVDIGSGSVKVTNADTKEYEISMGSGKFDVSGLTGTGEIDIGSGSGSVDFAAIDPLGSDIDVSSGSLKVYLPRGGSAEVEADISTGIVAIENCCGVSQKLTHDGSVSLGGGGRFKVELSSGKVSFYESKRFFIEQAVQLADEHVIFQVTETD